MGGATNDPKGHNVLGIADEDENITAAEGAPGNPYNCANSCHKTLAVAPAYPETHGPGGCQGCHREPAHHADDSATVIGAASPSTDGYYRFLSGHDSGENHGVCGIEDSDWQDDATASAHNEYLGFSHTKTVLAGFYNPGHTMTAFCCGCHGNFHKEQNDSGEWIRHPSDAVIPSTAGSEYAYAFGANGTGGAGLYDPLVPVARPSLTDWLSPSAGIAIGTDMVMCLSCHRPHGSEHDDLLRCDYGDMIAGGSFNTTGCFACHTKKDTGG